jgi:hypothetical protein
MALRSFMKIFDVFLGDVTLNAQSASGIGTAMGAGALAPAANTNQMGAVGNLATQTVNPGVSPDTTGSQRVLAVMTVPANVFDQAGRTLSIVAAGSVAANANTKTLQIVVNPTAPVVGSALSGGTVIGSLITAAAAGGGWVMEAEITKYGAVGSNTQLATHTNSQSAAVAAALLPPTALTLTESASFTIVISGNAATTASDIVQNFLQVLGIN